MALLGSSEECCLYLHLVRELREARRELLYSLESTKLNTQYLYTFVIGCVSLRQRKKGKTYNAGFGLIRRMSDRVRQGRSEMTY
jgi:hypothetical protein